MNAIHNKKIEIHIHFHVFKNNIYDISIRCRSIICLLIPNITCSPEFVTIITILDVGIIVITKKTKLTAILDHKSNQCYFLLF